ncbi:MAG: ABC transporter ATP-binding protein [Lachnospiraceae bacterium]|nr:ABC transporter ATP-binding protein [Lachnospiraceae bacterium]
MTIEAENITKIYDDRKVLDNFCLEIKDEAAYLITGPSGSGKTTFLNILLGLVKPDSGRIRLLGDYKYPYILAGTVFQEERLCEDFSAVRNVYMVNRKLSPSFAREELEQLLPADELDKPVRELSGGMRRRVSIVRAAAVPSDLLVMDEPFTGLDPETRQKAIEYILKKRGDKPLVITSHETEGLEFCRKVPIHP